MDSNESKERKVAEWVKEENKKDHLCACGCGEHIEITERHFERGIPRYIKGHNRRKKSLSEWVKKEQEKHRTCACGCGQEITIRKAHLYHGIPKYIKGHENQKAKSKEALMNYSWMYQNYRIEKLSTKTIGKILGCSATTVLRYLRKLGIEIYGNNETKIGVAFTEEHKEKIANANRGKKRSEKVRKKNRENRMKQKMPKTRTSIELTFEKFARELKVNVEYTGDSKLWIGNINPDFIIREKRIAIFVNGDYWHSPLLNRKVKSNGIASNQVKICKKHKWKAIIIWESDLKRKDAKAFVFNLLKKEGVIE